MTVSPVTVLLCSGDSHIDKGEQTDVRGLGYPLSGARSAERGQVRMDRSRMAEGWLASRDPQALCCVDLGFDREGIANG